MHVARIGAAGLEVGDDRQRLIEDRRIGRVRAQLRAQYVAKVAAGRGDQHEAAHVRIALRGHERMERAFAMAEQPSAARAGQASQFRGPGARVGGEDVDPQILLGGGGRGAGADAALVDAQASNATRGQTFGEQAQRPCRHPQRIVAVAVGRARSGQD